jgi:hypothetical protein
LLQRVQEIAEFQGNFLEVINFEDRQSFFLQVTMSQLFSQVHCSVIYIYELKFNIKPSFYPSCPLVLIVDSTSIHFFLGHSCWIMIQFRDFDP